MRRGIGCAIPWVIAWLAATSAGVAGSWLGCAAVLDGAGPAAPAVLSSVHSRHVVSLPARQPDATMAAPSRPGAASTAGGAGAASAAARTASAAASTPTPVAPASPTASPPAQASTPANPAPQAGTMLTPVPRIGLPDPTTGRPEPGGEPDPAPVEPSTGAAPSGSAPAAGTAQTFQTRGGTATLRFRRGKVELLDAQPAGDVQYVLEQTRPDALRLLFLADRQESELLAGWSGGPTVDIVEYWW